MHAHGSTDKEAAPVLGMFEREGSTTDGAVWIYNRTLLKIYDDRCEIPQEAEEIQEIHMMKTLLILILKVH
jgi:hypothetical protein